MVEKFKVACSAGDFEKAHEIFKNMIVHSSKNVLNVHLYCDVCDCLQWALQQNYFKLVKDIMFSHDEMESKLFDNDRFRLYEKESQFSCYLHEIACRLSVSINSVSINSDELTDLLEHLENKILLNSSTIPGDFAHGLLYHAFIYKRENFFTAFMTKRCTTSIDRTFLLNELFLTACGQGILECVRALYNVHAKLVRFDDLYLIQCALGRAVSGCHESVLIQLLAWWSNNNVLNILQAMFNKENRISRLRCMKRACPSLVVTTTVLSTNQPWIGNLRQLVQWCEDDVRAIFVPSCTNNMVVETVERIQQIEELESWFPGFRYMPNVDELQKNIICLTKHDMQVFSWKLKRCRLVIHESNLTRMMYTCFEHNTPEVCIFYIFTNLI